MHAWLRYAAGMGRNIQIRDVPDEVHRKLATRAAAAGLSLTAYDATFVALAELLEAPLVTCDTRLARAPGHRATVELLEGP